MPPTHDRPVPQRAQARRWFLATTVALGLSLLALFVGATLYVLQANRTIDQVDAQADLSIRLRDLQTMLVTLGDAETGQRGFLLTGKARYLAPYERALVRVPVLLESLDRIRLDAPGLRQHIDKMRALMELKFQELRQTVDLHRAGQHAKALEMVQSDVGQSYSEQVRTEINVVLDIVRGERDRLSAEVSRGETRSQRLLIISVSLFAGFVLLAAAQIWLAMRTRRQSDQLLAISEQQHRALVEEQAELVSQSTPKGMLTYVNPAYARYFGFEPAELIGRSLYDFVNAADRAAVRAHIDDVLATGETRQSENRMTVPNLGERWVSWTNRRQSWSAPGAWPASVAGSTTSGATACTGPTSCAACTRSRPTSCPRSRTPCSSTCRTCASKWSRRCAMASSAPNPGTWSCPWSRRVAAAFACARWAMWKWSTARWCALLVHRRT
jgi:PAS domain S-box-containing protein